MNRPSLNLPPDVARQRQMEMQQQNQLYSLAFQIYCSMHANPALVQEAETDLAKSAIFKAKAYRQIVEEDMKRGNER